MRFLLAALLYFLCVNAMQGQVAFDAFADTTNFATGNFTWTHTPVGTPKGVVVWVLEATTASEDGVTGVTYGGTSMTEVSGSPLQHGSGEFGTVHCFFLGSSVPTGAASVAVTTSNANSKVGGSVTFTASDDTELVDVDATMNSDSQENPSVTLSASGRTVWAGIGFYSGQNAPSGIAPLTNWTDRTEDDIGTKTMGIYTYDTIGSSDVTAGWTQTADDATMIAVLVAQVAGAAPPRNRVIIID